MSKLFTTILPSLLAGGLLFGSALTGAQPAPPVPPAPPAPVVRPPKPPKAPKIHVDLGDLDKMVDQQIAQALEQIDDNDQMPPQVRAKIKQRLEKVRAKVKQRLSHLDLNDLEALGDELGDMGNEIGDEMEDFGQDMEKWGKDYAKQLEKQMKSKRMVWRGPHASVDVDLGDDDMTTFEAFEDDSGDVDDAMKDLGDFKLAAGQREQLRKLRADSDRRVASAKRELDQASERLRELLAAGSVSDQEIARSIDNVTRLEGEIRKARILAWVNARRLLDDTQRKKIESAVRRSK